MAEFKRFLSLSRVLTQRSAFLLGARGVGKTTLIAAQLPKARVYDLLDQRVYLRLLRDATLLEQDNPKDENVIVIDEIQKMPELLDEVQRLIGRKKHRFLLTGSSARKLKRQGTNLLGGRARLLHMYPLTWQEIGPDAFKLERYLNHGGLPDMYLSSEPREDLEGYIGLYLREEVAAEALARRLDQFARFLDVVAMNNGEELHLENMASDAGVKSRTLSNYVEILEDTLLGFNVMPYGKSKKRKAITRAKFFLFDVGVTGSLTRRKPVTAGDEVFERAFEHFIAMELRALVNYHHIDSPLQYWRTRSGFEVDFIVDDRIAIEVKATRHVTTKHLRGLKALQEEAGTALESFMVISFDPHERLLGNIRIVPWEQALQELWSASW